MRASSFAIATAIFLVALSMNPLALAQTEGQGGYIGVGFGKGSADLSVSDFNDGSITSGRVDDTDTGWKLFGGYGFNKNFAVEGGYADLGESNFNGTSNGLGFLYFAGPVNIDIETKSLFVDLVAIMPFKKWSLFGKIGFHNWDAEVTVSNPPVSGSADDDGTDPHFGVGAEWRPSPRWGLRLEWEVFTEVLEEDIEAISLSGIYRFGNGK